MLAVAAALLGAALGPWAARATVRLAARDRTLRPGRVRMVLTTLLTAALLGGTTALVGARPALVGLLWVAGAGVVLAGVDLATHRLPDVVTFPAVAVLLVSVLVDGVVDGDPQRALDGVGSAIAAFAVLALARLISPAGLGFGDVKLVALIGLALGWRAGGQLVITGVFLGFVLGAVGAVLLLVARRAGWRTAIPFGPPLLVGAAVAFALAGPV